MPSWTSSPEISGSGGLRDGSRGGRGGRSWRRRGSLAAGMELGPAEVALHLRLRGGGLDPERESLPAARTVKTLAASIHGGGRYRPARRASSVVLLAVLSLAACAKRDD